MSLARRSQSGVRPPAKPPVPVLTVRKRELVYECAHCIGKTCNTLRVAEPHLEQRVVPDRDQACHRLSQLARTCMRALQALAPLLDQA